jgi:3-deoxy-7-phosphoheptulonate synthase
MVVVMEAGASETQIQEVIQRLNDLGFDVHRSSGVNQTVIGAIGVQPDFDTRHIRLIDGVADVFRVTSPYKFASREWRATDTIVRVGKAAVGGTEVVVMAGPCSVENADQIDATARHVAACGARILRGGAFKPRTSPYAFQGLGEAGLDLLRDAADRYGLAVATEVMEMSQIDAVYAYADLLQVGARNMQNFPLLREIGKRDKPVLLKRGVSATIEEWLMSAEYILSQGNPNVILCERGIRTFETYTRNTLDISSVPVIQKKSHLPIIVDPSHGTGLRDKVTPMARAAVAAGCDGLLIETHPDPGSAMSDGPQSLFFEQFAELMRQIRLIAEAIGRHVQEPPAEIEKSGGLYSID